MKSNHVKNPKRIFNHEVAKTAFSKSFPQNFTGWTFPRLLKYFWGVYNKYQMNNVEYPSLDGFDNLMGLREID